MSSFGTRNSGLFGANALVSCQVINCYNCGVEVLGSGCCSTVRCSVNNDSSGAYSGSFGGQCNTSSGYGSVVLGGDKNIAQATNSFIGGGRCNNVCNSVSENNGFGSVVVGGVGNNTIGGTYNFTTNSFTVAPTICNSGARTFIGGGFQNKTSANSSAVVGGYQNTASAIYTFIGGGAVNNATTSYATVGGGFCNNALGNGSFVGGGNCNFSCLCTSTIGGGRCNIANACYSFIGAGFRNTVSGYFASLSGSGRDNSATNTGANVNGGRSNTASGVYSVIGGGLSNTASGCISNVGGGQCNTASGYGSVVLGGLCNMSCASYSSSMGICALSYLYGQSVNSTGSFATQGGGQSSCTIAWREAVMNANANVDMSLDGTGTTNLIIPLGNNRGWNVYVDWILVVTSLGSGTSGGLAVGAIHDGTDAFFFKRVGGVASISTQTNIASHNDAGMASSNVAFSVGASNNLRLQMNAPSTAGTDTTFRGVANIRFVEVAW